MRVPRSDTNANYGVFNLTFHGLGVPETSIEIGEKPYWLDIEPFDRMLEVVGFWANNRITFDDGNLSDLTIALPRLLRRGFKATFFVVSGRIGLPGYLGRSEMQELLAAGMEIGSHGMHHRSWRNLRNNDEEIAGAKARLEDALGIPITQAACPFGEYGKRTLRQLTDAGFTRVYTSDRGWARADAWFQPRNTIAAATEMSALARIHAWSMPRRWVHGMKLAIKRQR